MGNTVINYLTSVGNAGIRYGSNGTVYDSTSIAGVVYVQPYIPFPGDNGTPCLYVACTTDIPASLSLIYQSAGDIATGGYNPNASGDWNTGMYPLDGLDLNLAKMTSPAWTQGDNIAIAFNLNDYKNGLNSNRAIGFNPDSYPVGGYPKSITAANSTDAGNFSFFKDDTFADGVDDDDIFRTVVLLCTMQSSSGTYPAINFQVQLLDTSNSNHVLTNYRVDPRIKNNG